jgi:signal transduction histidine kinase
MNPAALGVGRVSAVDGPVPQVLPHLAYVDLDGHTDRVSRLVRQALRADAAIVGMVAGARFLLVGQDGQVPHLQPAFELLDDGPCHGQLTLPERDHQDRAWAAAYAGAPVEIPGLALTALVGVVRPDPWTWSADQLDCLDEYAQLAVSVIHTELRDEVLARLEDLVPRLAGPLDDLDDVVRRTTDLVERPGDPRLPRMADVVRHRLDAVEVVAGQLGELSHARTGGSPEIDLCKVVRVVTSRSVTSDPRSELVVELPDRPVWVAHPRVALERAVSRLVSAAVHDAVPAARGRVQVSDADGAALLEVVVPGPGIPLPGLLRLVGATETLTPEPAPVAVSLDAGRLVVRSRELEARTDSSGSVIRLVLVRSRPREPERGGEAGS